MTAISVPQAKSSIFFLDLPAVTLKEKKIREERTIIYNAFLKTLKNLEKDTHHYIQKIQKKLLDTEIEESDRDALEKILVKQNELLAQLQSDKEKKILNFILANDKKIFKVDQEKIEEFNELNEKNFSRLLVLVYKKIRAKGLADEKNLKNGEIKKVSGWDWFVSWASKIPGVGFLRKIPGDENSLEGSAIKKVVDSRIDKARRAEAWDWFVSLKSKIPGVGFLRKIPGFEKILGKEEEEEKKQLSEIGMATQFLRKSLWPIVGLIIVVSLGGLSGPISVLGLTIPHAVVIGSAVLGFVTAEYKAVKGLFSNDEKCTFVDDSAQSFSSQDIDAVKVKVQEQTQQKQKEAKEQAKKCGEEFSEKISNIILNTPVKETEKSKHVSTSKEVIVTRSAPTKPAASTKWRQSVDERKDQAKAGAEETLKI